MTRTTRIITALLALALAGALTAGCSRQAAEKPAAPAEKQASGTTYPLTITDDASRTVTVKAEPQRIVSLAPANTEILFALGLGDKVVGVTSYDDYPAEVTDIAKVGDFAGPNLEAVAGANPDLVLATTGVQADVIGKLEELGATVIAVDPQTLDGVYSAIDEIAAVTNKQAEGEKVVGDMKTGIAEVEKAVAGEDKTTAFIEIGQNPLFTTGSGTLLDELITLAGGKNVVAEPGYVPYSVEQLIKSNPAVYLATKGSSNDPAAITQRAGYSGLAAVKANRIAILDDSQVSRPGPRLVEGLRQIAKALHPDAFAE